MTEERRRQLLSKEQLTVPEAAELWGVQYVTVLRYIKEKLLDGRNIAPPGTRKSKWVVSTGSLKKRMGIEEETPVG